MHLEVRYGELFMVNYNIYNIYIVCIREHGLVVKSPDLKTLG